jgi:hypothetical protein
MRQTAPERAKVARKVKGCEVVRRPFVTNP